MQIGRVLGSGKLLGRRFFGFFELQLSGFELLFAELERSPSLIDRVLRLVQLSVDPVLLPVLLVYKSIL